MRRVFSGLAVRLAIIPILWPALAGASGMFALPEQRMELATFAACYARLQSAEQEARAAATPLATAPDGTTQEIFLQSDTSGVQRLTEASARYHRRLWFHNGRPAEHDQQQREVSHSWEEQDMRCEGVVLSIASASGYTLPTFEPTAATQPSASQ